MTTINHSGMELWGHYIRGLYFSCHLSVSWRRQQNLEEWSEL